MRRTVVAAAAAVALVALTGAPAAAQTVSVGDKHERYLPARLDLAGARYTNSSSGLSAKVTVRNLQAGTYTLGFNLAVPGSAEEIHVLVTRTTSGKLTNTIVIALPDEQVTRHCGGLDSTWKNKRDYITVDIPWRCLDQLKKDLKVQAFFGAGNGTSGDPADFIKTVRVNYN
jgi:hypothetical protein